MMILHNIYPYDASFGAAVAFFAIFLIITLVNTFQLFRTRTWFFVPFLLGGYFELVGYAARSVSIKQQPNYSLPPFLTSTILVLVAPALFAASIYMSLGRIIRLTDGSHLSIIRPNWLTKIFVLGDVVSFFAQVVGGSMLAGQKASDIKRGNNIITLGLVVQILFFCLFIGTSISFNIRIRWHSTKQSANCLIPWQKHMAALYTASLIVLVRCLYRLVEYREGSGGYLNTHEWCPYVFDAALMALVMICFTVVHPSEINALLQGRGTVIRRVFTAERIHAPGEADAIALEYNLRA